MARRTPELATAAWQAPWPPRQLEPMFVYWQYGTADNLRCDAGDRTAGILPGSPHWVTDLSDDRGNDQWIDGREQDSKRSIQAFG
jgi:hypothetical protein